MYANTTYKEYLTLSNRCYKNPLKLLKEKDDNQAAEKLWDTPAQSVKSYPDKNRLKHSSHNDLWKVIYHIMKRSKGEELKHSFYLANSLPIHFCEDNSNTS